MEGKEQSPLLSQEPESIQVQISTLDYPLTVTKGLILKSLTHICAFGDEKCNNTLWAL